MKLLYDFPRIGDVQEISNGRELLNRLRSYIPDIVILDLEMPGLDGFQVCSKLVNQYPEVKILIVSMHDNKASIYSMLEAGAHAFLSKDSDCEELEVAINAIVDKGIYRNKKMRDALRVGVRGNNVFRNVNISIHLTDRELTIVNFLCKEYTTRQISTELGLSENTIRNHKVRIMRKLGVKNVSGLVKYAVANGMVILI